MIKCPDCQETKPNPLGWRPHLQYWDYKETGVETVYLCDKCQKEFIDFEPYLCSKCQQPLGEGDV